jgi:hypothetical protein
LAGSIIGRALVAPWELRAPGDAAVRHHVDRALDGSIVAALIARSFDARPEDAATAAAMRDVAIAPPAPTSPAAGRSSRDLPARQSMDRRHPLTGADMLARAGATPAVVAAVAVHHERLDGSGYPVGLPGDAVATLGRVVGVADAFVAMVRPSAAGLSMDPAGAFQVLRFATRSRFDERAIVALADLIAEGTIGGREATRRH